MKFANGCLCECVCVRLFVQRVQCDPDGKHRLLASDDVREELQEVSVFASLQQAIHLDLLLLLLEE